MPFSQRVYKTLAIVSTTGLAAVSYLTYHNTTAISDEAVTRDEQNRTTLLHNCEQVGDPLLHAQIHSTKSEISDTRAQLQRGKSLDLGVVAKKLGVPKQTLLDNRQDLRNKIVTDHYILKPLVGAPTCAERYPPIHG